MDLTSSPGLHLANLLQCLTIMNHYEPSQGRRHNVARACFGGGRPCSHFATHAAKPLPSGLLPGCRVWYCRCEPHRLLMRMMLMFAEAPESFDRGPYGGHSVSASSMRTHGTCSRVSRDAEATGFNKM